MKAILSFVKSIILVVMALVLLESLYLITTEANQLSGNLDKTFIIVIVYLICLILIFIAVKLMLKSSKLGVFALVVIIITSLFLWPSYKSFPTNPLITADELYSLTLKNNINVSNSEIYIYDSGSGWVEVKKIRYEEIMHKENKQKRVVGIRIRNSNLLNIIKLNSSGFYSIPVLIPIKEFRK